ncbi:hypothetical protein DOTSEDRAFT_46271 [Dothistroma septosporum NZE10]|uniref:Methyltransferase type 11 domain-containing protein n=1 Tax=Dothistroma septosporum (strain NZE10 / CBS 128990) TaxID=675120 RepID=N1PGJ2_DOTSN|nr:hypothetical protein DOTSEDRAFT_46271 [Dothistroma septosporum NZE10]
MPNGQPVDMLASREAVHWTNMDVLATKLQNILKPRGALAFWIYGTRRIFPKDPESAPVEAAFNAANNKNLRCV